MIRVHIDMAHPALNIDGHAGYAASGSDIVCAAASMLAYTLLFRVRSLACPGDVLEESVEKGRMRIAIQPESERKPAFTDAFETVREGFRHLARQYPEHVSVSENT